MKVVNTPRYEAWDGTRFDAATDCRAYERESAPDRLVGLTKDQITAALTRTDVEPIDAQYGPKSLVEFSPTDIEDVYNTGEQAFAMTPAPEPNALIAELRSWATERVTRDRWSFSFVDPTRELLLRAAVALKVAKAQGAEEMRVERDAMRKALETIAKQKTQAEIIDEYGFPSGGDFEAAYDTLVVMARDVLRTLSTAPEATS